MKTFLNNGFLKVGGHYLMAVIEFEDYLNVTLKEIGDEYIVGHHPVEKRDYLINSSHIIMICLDAQV